MFFRVIGVTELGLLRLYDEVNNRVRVVDVSAIRDEELDILPTYEIAVLQSRSDREYYVLRASKNEYKLVTKEGQLITVTPEQMYTLADKLINMHIKNKTLQFYDTTRINEKYFDIHGDILEESAPKTPEAIRIPSYVRRISKKAFKNNSSLYIQLTNVEVIEPKAFINSAVTVINLNNKTVEIGYDAFKGCSRLNFVRGVGALRNIGKRAFAECTNLQYFPFNTVAGDLLIDEEAFRNTGLQTICFTNGESEVDIRERAFKNCDFITKLESNGLTSVADYALYGCRGLESIALGNNRNIGKYAFSNTERLKTVNIANSDNIHNLAFEGSKWGNAM